MRKRFLWLFIFLVSLVSMDVSAQNIPNPKTLTFTSLDWSVVERHELEILLASDNSVVQTLTDNGPYTSKNITVNLNVQPVTFGTYVFRARACNTANGCSAWSLPSNLWDRALWTPESVVAE